VSLNVQKLNEATDDNELFELLSTELATLFSPQVQSDTDLFLASLAAAPAGLRAMASVHELDVSMTLDDLAWHFGNHNDERFLLETEVGLKELGAIEAAVLFHSAWMIMEPYFGEIRSGNWDEEDFGDFLERVGVQSKVDPLNEQLWAICKKCGNLGLLQYWVNYARQYPERCATEGQ
jgi:hypothetical protein